MSKSKKKSSRRSAGASSVVSSSSGSSISCDGGNSSTLWNDAEGVRRFGRRCATPDFQRRCDALEEGVATTPKGHPKRRPRKHQKSRRPVQLPEAPPNRRNKTEGTTAVLPEQQATRPSSSTIWQQWSTAFWSPSHSLQNLLGLVETAWDFSAPPHRNAVQKNSTNVFLFAGEDASAPEIVRVAESPRGETKAAPITAFCCCLSSDPVEDSEGPVVAGKVKKDGAGGKAKVDGVVDGAVKKADGGGKAKVDGVVDGVVDGGKAKVVDNGGFGLNTVPEVVAGHGIGRVAATGVQAADEKAQSRLWSAENRVDLEAVVKKDGGPPSGGGGGDPVEEDSAPVENSQATVVGGVV